MSATKHYLKDYKRPDYRIDAMSLWVDIDPKLTRVRSRFQVFRDKKAAEDAPLVLHGTGFRCMRFFCHGKSLSIVASKDHPDEIVLHDVADGALFEIDTELNPSESTDLTGLYAVGDRLFTQCEPHGFRRITYGLDRPDVLTVFTVTMKANQARFPHLLCNGVIEKTAVEGEDHWVRWHDPKPKPSYLFAMVAGQFDVLEDQTTTPEGRRVDLYAYVEPGRKHQAAFALSAVKRAMAFDATDYGRSYDLDRYSLVVADDFNQGAMENTGLNIFNAKYVLCDPDITTDDTKILIDNVVAHEYFHHWTGNRVTLCNWFQLSLKEGLTVYRDQSYTATQFGPLRARLNQVKGLKTRQFKEDSGPMSHPVLPKSYVSMDNFYTVTIYEKGAELIRMAALLLGPLRYREAMDDYFDRFTGQAVAIEALLACFQRAAPDLDFKQFRRWYDQAGTPHVHLRWRYDASAQTLHIKAQQMRQDQKPLSEDQAWLIPIKMTLFSEKGAAIKASGPGIQPDQSLAFVLSLTQPEQTWVLQDVHEPVHLISFFQDFSAPVTSDDGYDLTHLLFLMRHDSDAYSRYDAACRLKISLIDAEASGHLLDDEAGRCNRAMLDNLMLAILADDKMDPYLKGTLLSPLSLDHLIQVCRGDYDLETLDAARKSIQFAWLSSASERLKQAYDDLAARCLHTGEDAALMDLRFLKNILLFFCVKAAPKKHAVLAMTQLTQADNMTDRLASLQALNGQDGAMRADALAWFYDRYAQEPLALDYWFALQAKSSVGDPIETVEHLLRHAAFHWTKPNTVRALVGAFIHFNLLSFHEKTGAGYRLLASILGRLDAINAKLAAQLGRAFLDGHYVDHARQSLMQDAVAALKKKDHLSNDLMEILDRA